MYIIIRKFKHHKFTTAIYFCDMQLTTLNKPLIVVSNIWGTAIKFQYN